MKKFKYAIGDVVKFKDKFGPSASSGLKELAGRVVIVAACRAYGEPCYKFEGLEEFGWFTEGALERLETSIEISAREATNKVLEMADAGLISWSALAMMALKWMSEDDVAEMLKANEILLDSEEDEDYED